MSSYILFLILGLGAGATYAILGLGLVLKYRSGGIVDFAHGALAMWIAYVFVDLRTNGVLQFPWIVIPHQGHGELDRDRHDAGGGDLAGVRGSARRDPVPGGVQAAARGGAPDPDLRLGPPTPTE
jgi:hypothetical protein